MSVILRVDANHSVQTLLGASQCIGATSAMNCLHGFHPANRFLCLLLGTYTDAKPKAAFAGASAEEMTHDDDSK